DRSRRLDRHGALLFWDSATTPTRGWGRRSGAEHARLPTVELHADRLAHLEHPSGIDLGADARAVVERDVTVDDVAKERYLHHLSWDGPGCAGGRRGRGQAKAFRADGNLHRLPRGGARRERHRDRMLAAHRDHAVVARRPDHL